VFCVTDFWQHLGAGLDADAAGEKEAAQAFNIALAASKVTTLQHFVFSTLPKARDLTSGTRPVPHMDHKAKCDDRIRSDLPELAAKTTFVWMVRLSIARISSEPPLTVCPEFARVGMPQIWCSSH
jgi:hypothetical protein